MSGSSDFTADDVKEHIASQEQRKALFGYGIIRDLTANSLQFAEGDAKPLDMLTISKS